MRLNRYVQIAVNEEGSAREAVWVEVPDPDGGPAKLGARFQVFRPTAEHPSRDDWRAWKIATRIGGQTILMDREGGANELAGGGLRWMAYLTVADPKLFGSQVWLPQSVYVGDIELDGSYAVAQDAEKTELHLYGPGQMQAIPRGVVFEGGPPRVRSHLLAWSQGPHGTVKVFDLSTRRELAVSQLSTPYWSPCAFKGLDGRVWLMGYIESSWGVAGGVIHPIDNPLQGHRFGDLKKVYSPDLVPPADLLIQPPAPNMVYAAWARDEGQREHAVTHFLLGENMERLTPVVVPVPPMPPPAPRRPGRNGLAPRFNTGDWIQPAEFWGSGPDALWPRRHDPRIVDVPGHPLDRRITIAPNGDKRIVYQKFEQEESYEVLVIRASDGSLWLELDASNTSDKTDKRVAAFSNPLWLPGRMQLGEQYAVKVPPHIHYEKNRDCSTYKEHPFERRCWVEMERWYVNEDFPDVDVLVVVSDPTADIHNDERGIERHLAGRDVDWLGWEWHPSPRVYPQGRNGGKNLAVLNESTRTQWNMFYMVGGDRVPIKECGCGSTIPAELPVADIKTDFLNMPGATFDLRWASYSAAERSRRIAAHKAAGHNYVCLMAIENDDASQFNLYHFPLGAQALVAEIRAAGLKAMMWLLCETPEVVGSRTPAEWADQMRAFVSMVDADAYCVGLELDENFDEDEIGAMADRLREVTTRPIYIHGSQGWYPSAVFWQQYRSVTGLLFQYAHDDLPGGGFISSASDAKFETFEVLGALKGVGRPVQFVPWEYAYTPNGGHAVAIAAIAKAIRGAGGGESYGNGVGSVVDVPVPADAIDPSGVTWLRTNGSVGAWARTSALTGVVFADNGVCLLHSKAGQWPIYQLNGDTPVEANPIIIVRHGGKLYGATWDWFREAQECKSITAAELGPDQINRPPLDASWPGPAHGEDVWMMVSAVSRDGLELVRERSNIVAVKWGVGMVTPGPVEPPVPPPADELAALYLRVLGRPIDPFGRDYYTRRIQKDGWTIATCEANMKQSKEYRVDVRGLALDPLLDGLLDNYDFFTDNRQQLEVETVAWYKRGHGGRMPADKDIAHGFYWRAMKEAGRFPTLREALRDTWPMGGPVE